MFQGVRCPSFLRLSFRAPFHGVLDVDSMGIVVLDPLSPSSAACRALDASPLLSAPFRSESLHFRHQYRAPGLACAKWTIYLSGCISFFFPSRPLCLPPVIFLLSMLPPSVTWNEYRCSHLGTCCSKLPFIFALPPFPPDPVPSPRNPQSSKRAPAPSTSNFLCVISS